MRRTARRTFAFSIVGPLALVLLACVMVFGKARPAYASPGFWVQVSWDDEGNEDKRPESVSLSLRQDGEEKALFTISENTTTVVFTKAVTSSAGEAGVPEGYTIHLDNSTPWIANALPYWSTSKGEWTLVETDVPEGYEVGESNYYYSDEAGSVGSHFAITNTYVNGTPTGEPELIPKAETVDIPVRVQWDDDENALNNRPDSVKVDLVAYNKEHNGFHWYDKESSQSVCDVVDTLEVRAADGWEGVFAAKPKFDASGDEIRYALRGEVNPSCYVPDEPYTEFTGDTAVIVNRRNMDLELSVCMVWDDAGHEGERPKSASFNLMDSEGKLLETITLTSADQSRTVWSLLGHYYPVARSGVQQPADETYVWVGNFSFELPPATNGRETEFRITESAIEGYDSVVGSVLPTQKGNGRIQFFQNTYHDDGQGPIALSNGNTVVECADRTYTGKGLTPTPTVKFGGTTLAAGTDYTVAYANNVNAGTATITVTGKGNYTGAVTGSFKIQKAASSIKLAAQTKTYTGKTIAYSGKVTRSGSTGKVNYKYFSDAACKKAVKAANVKNAGTYYVKATLAADGNHKAATSKAAKLTVAKAAQPMKLASVKRTAKASTVKKKAVTVAAPLKFTKKAQGTVTYAKVTKGSAKCLTVNMKNGKVTVKRGTKKGTYKVKIKVTAKGNKNYKSGSKTVASTVVVK